MAVGLCQLAGIIGSVFTVSAIPTWYATLMKPEWNPPGWLFGPVWTTLYTLMGIALYRVWKKGIDKKSVRPAVLLFLIHLAFNAAWSIIFFGLHSITGALVEIVMLLILIVAVIEKFYKIDRTAAYLLIPYVVWVSFATFLTFTIWILNPTNT